MLILATIAPNAVGGCLNFAYNRSEIIARLPGAESVFLYVQTAINGVAFPLGVVILILLARPILVAFRWMDAGLPVAADVLTAAQRRCLVLGDLTAAVGVAEWLLAGLAYPVSLCAAIGWQPTAFFVHFFISLALCGLMAAIHPFFWVTFLTVRVLLPPLLKRQGVDAAACVGMERLKRRTGLYLLSSAAAPMLSVAAMAAMGSENRAALGILSVVGLAGSGRRSLCRGRCRETWRR
jgi:hypothetical protein